MEAVEIVVREAGRDVIAWEIRLGGRPARESLDEVARTILGIRRAGYDAALRGPAALGVAAVLGSVQVLGQAEEGEEPGVEEVVVPDDPVA
jgi:hypothetical protein